MVKFKCHIKIWSVNATNGYLCHFEVYTGKDDEENTDTPAGQQPPSCSFKGLSSHVVHNFTQSLSGKNSFVFMDFLFSSVELFLKLFVENTYCCGNVRENRKGFPPALKGLRLVDQGVSKFAQFQNLVCTVWKDKVKSKNVAPLSTQYSPNKFDKVERKKNPGSNAGYRKI